VAQIRLNGKTFRKNDFAPASDFEQGIKRDEEKRLRCGSD
jgi:hypothetical protein